MEKTFECDMKEICCKDGFDCEGCLYEVVYQLAMKHEQENQKRSIKNNVD